MPAPTATSTSRPAAPGLPSFRQELRVVAVVLAFVAGLEGYARFRAPSLDYDRQHIHALPATIAGLESRAAATGDPRLIFFGNSLILRGLDEPTFHREFRHLGGPALETTKIAPVGTAILDWHYLYQRYFLTPASHPDVLVVGFISHHLHDREPVKLRRLARHFVAPRDFPELWRTEVGDFHGIAQSLLCHASAIAGDQPEHQLALLNACVPDYLTGLKANHRMVESAAARHAGSQPAAAPADTFRRLARFLETCRVRRVKVYLVAMPQPELWTLHPAVVSLARDHGTEVLDARAIDGITPADFSDGYHLGEAGAGKFSRWLAAALRDRPLRR